MENSVDNPAGTETGANVMCPSTYKVLGVGGVGASDDTAVTLNSLLPVKATRPTLYGATAWVNNAGIGDDTAYAIAVCGKLKDWSMTQSATVDNPSGTESLAEQACPTGTVPTGGGVFASSGETSVDINSTLPDPGGKIGWGAFENNASVADNTIYAKAPCAL